ncbi:MAG: ATP-binding cassette domain-containing protein [Meiothermus sp.]|uniref:ABC transporter ATP-binding protein n=1 Tax=Meiothermus sp. TaxID=1955249 RepID=UPI00298EDBD2|nr:ATP-binding cassette domain-containing protein [Meiothermus sp.]MDW8480804.1 ATP-binding cassette domain-containing protein [Meiothermus sp.]
MVFPNGTVALKEANLEVAPGEFISLIGPSGCGKTTLLRLLADLIKPTAGTIYIGGKTPEEARKARAYGYVFQAPTLMEWRTVLANVMLPLEIMGFPPAERKARAERMLELVGLERFARHYPWQLSGGCSSGSPLPGPWPSTPTSSSWTSPLGPWMKSPART